MMRLKKFTGKKKKKLICFLSALVFLCLLFHVFCDVTYLFRNTGYERNHITGLKGEQQKLDMVYVGGSAAFVYWAPLKAWNDFGFASYCYATNTIQAESIQPYLEESSRYQHPRLYVIGVRAFQYYSDEPEDSGLRNASDSMDLTSPARYKMLWNYFQNRKTAKDTDRVSFVFDIAKYHTNTSHLGDSESWGYLHNQGTSPDKGWEWIDAYRYLSEPKDFQTDERAELPKNDRKTLESLLSYCQAKKLNALFVVCPYSISREDQERFNTMKDMVEQAGFRFLNTNEYYQEMDLDFSTDFYNAAHVNVLGAEKYTEFLGNYIDETYHMPDHREEAAYAEWNDEGDRFAEEEKTHADTISNMIGNINYTEEVVRQMKAATSLTEWNALADDSRFILLMEGTGEQIWPDNLADQKVLVEWGLEKGETDFVRAFRNGESLLPDGYKEGEPFDGHIGNEEAALGFHAAAASGSGALGVGDTELAVRDNGINVAVIEVQHQELVQQMFLSVDGTGKLCMTQIS